MKKVLITGANGFLGNYILEHFRINGYEVKGWVRTHREAEKQFVSRVDMLDSTAVEEALAMFEPDIVVHCAGSANVNLSVSHPELDFNGNVKLTHNLLFSLKKMGLMKTRFIFLSSAAVYGNPVSLPISEDAELNPLSPYALHKVMCENICCYFAKNYGMDIKIARIFSAYGIGLKKQIFWDMYQKSKRTDFLEMFGTGLESRDYINVKDAVNAIYLLANKAPKEEIFFNVGNGCEITIKEATETFANFYGIPNEKISFIGKAGEGHPTGWQADITKIKELGYHKTISFDQGIKEYVNWVIESQV